MQLTVRNWENAEVGTLEVSDRVFGAEVRADILHRVVNWQLAKRRAGTHKVQERGEVNRTKSKWYRQKGTGRARHGAQNANIFRGGGVVHGPRVRDHGFSLPKKIRALGMRCALSSKAQAGQLIVLESDDSGSGKTKELKAKLDALGIKSALLVSGASVDENLRQAASNLIGIDVLPQQGANVYDILRRESLVMTREAIEHLQARLDTGATS
ncbi:MAG TPA: 50S ribosomal protein L4 [Alphaproteobacteria bacterium]|nr:50S ribosomal protein L4 [Alphaproteobacteria bacterium]